MGSRSWLAAGLFAGTPAVAASVDPLLLTRTANDLELHWTLDPTAAGYDLRRVDTATTIPMIDQELPLLSLGPSPTLPVVLTDGVTSPPGLQFYDVRPSGSQCAHGSDRDLDRLDDCVESGTGVFVDLSDTGTDPDRADSDRDGIDDGDEVLGTLAGLDLPALGANPVHQDVFIEYDWFDDAVDCGMHSHRPDAAAVDLVTAAFAAAPVSNPDRTTGISVHHDFGQGAPFTGGNYIDDPDGFLGGVNWTDFRDYKLANLDPRRQGYFFYAILPHKYGSPPGTSSGQAELTGNDFIVSLHCNVTTSRLANTIAHEIGHNFSLLHGGLDECNRKPNYNSVMNYSFQFPGVDNDCTPPGNGVLDYSHGDRIELDENDLDERAGTCGSVAWDWDGDMTIEPSVSVNLNLGQDSDCGGAKTVLRDYNDWAFLHFGGLGDSDFAPREVIDCDPEP